MTTAGPDILILREGTEGLDMEPYYELVSDRLSNHDVRLARTPDEERSLIKSATIVSGVRLDEELLNRAEAIELFSCVFAGTDHLPWSALMQRDITVTNAGGIHVPGIAEHAIGMLLVFVRRLDEGLRRQQRHEWRHFQSYELAGSTVTIVGLGAIGTAIADRLNAFDVRTIGVRYTPEKGGPTDEVIGYSPEKFHRALADSDYVVLACPLTEVTDKLIDAEALVTLPSRAVLINIARGGIIDTAALVEAIQDNQIRGAGLDVTDPEPLPGDHPLWDFGNVLITPHSGGHNPNHWDRMAALLEQNVRQMAEGGEMNKLENVVAPPYT